MDGVAIRRIERIDPVAIAGLLAESEREGFGFVRRLVDEDAGGTNRFDRPGEALFGAYAAADGRLVGICGLNRDPYSGDPDVGRVRHLYVLPDRRRSGVGRRLVAAVISEATPVFRALVLRTTNLEADRFYRGLGFIPTSAIPHATHRLALERRAEGGSSVVH